MEFVEIPEGSFLLGSMSDHFYSDQSDTPIRRVWLPAYRIMLDPVTVRDWREYTAQIELEWPCWSLLEEICPTDDYPVVYTSWTEAVSYAQWLSLTRNRRIALPTNAQWEKACRGTDGRAYPWGDDESLIPSVEHDVSPPYRLAPWRSKYGRPDILYPIESPYGCRHMGQNVHEFCSDWYDDDYYKYLDPIAPIGQPLAEKRTTRGSDLRGGPPICFRRRSVAESDRNRGTGFRLVIND